MYQICMNTPVDRLSRESVNTGLVLVREFKPLEIVWVALVCRWRGCLSYLIGLPSARAAAPFNGLSRVSKSDQNQTIFALV
jgi:hypothetical protein